MFSSPTFVVDAADLPVLRSTVDKIARTGYNETRIRERLGLSDLTELQWRTLPIHRQERLAIRDPLASAIDLLLLQGAVPAEEIAGFLSEIELNALVRTGLLLRDQGGFLRAGASLFPVGDRLIFSDHAWHKLPHPGFTIVPHDQVMYIGTDSRWLAHATSRRPVGTALDLCTGSGIHALLAASHARRVLAVDINPRAVLCAQLNAQVSGSSNVETLCGDLYAELPDERFDLITANPPFVPSPVDAVGFRDGGSSGEEVQRRIIAGLPSHLAPGGTAQIVTELGEGEQESISDRLRQWLDGAPMDIYILRLRETPAAGYAIGHAEGDDSFAAFLDSVGEWAANLRAQGYSRIVSVLLAFRWSDPASGPPWTRSEEAQPPRSPAGTEIEAAFHAERVARNPGFPEILGESRVRRTGPIGMMESRVLGQEGFFEAQAQLLGTSLRVAHSIDPAERALLMLLERPLAVGELLHLGEELRVDRATVLAALRSLVARRLILLTPVGDSPA